MPSLNAEILTQAKSLGFSDRQIAHLTGTTEDAVRAERKRLGLVPSYRLVDTCAAEFEAYTPYYYSTYDRGDDEVKGNTAKKVMILGGGPNRIGQGIEFDYCCVHAAFALKEDGFETIMVNSNPETVPPITTPATNYFSSRSHSKTCCTFTNAKNAGARSRSSAGRRR